MELHGQFERGDYLRYVYYHFLRSTWFLFGAALVCFMLLLFYLVSSEHGSHTPDWAFFTAALITLLILAIRPYTSAVRQFNSDPARETITMTFGPDGFAARRPSVFWEAKWQIVQLVRETKSMFVLYSSPTRAICVIPKRFFANIEQLNDWRALLRRVLPAKAFERPTLAARWC